MAAPAGSGYGMSVEDDAVKAVEVGEAKRDGPKVVTGEGAQAVEDLNGSKAAGPEGNGKEEEEEQVAKKPRVEKAENGGADKAGESVAENVQENKGEGVHGDGEVENGAGEEVKDGEEKEDEEKESGKGDAAPGDAGSKSLLHEGETKKTTVASHGVDATHTMNGAK